MNFARPYSLVVSLALVLTPLLGATACKKLAKTEAAPEYSVGEKVDVKWKGSWWKGQILARTGAKYRVHYTGWSARWDEDVTADRIRPSSVESEEGTEVSGAGAPAGDGAWNVGDKVDVQWNGQWWAAEILAPDGDKYRVHYTGWASSWDESVPPSRIRAATAGAKRGTGK